MMTSAGGAFMTVLTCAIGRLLLAELKLDVLGLLLMAMLLIGEVTLGVAWLRRMSGSASPASPKGEVTE